MLTCLFSLRRDGCPLFRKMLRRGLMGGAQNTLGGGVEYSGIYSSEGYPG